MDAILSHRTHSSGSEERHLVLLLASSSLALALGVDASSEGVLVTQGDDVNNVYPDSQQKPGGLSIPKSSSKEAHSGTPVHGSAGHVEWKASHHVIHEEAEVVTKEGSSNTEGPSRRDDKNISSDEEGSCYTLDVGSVEERVRGLFGNSILVEEIANDAKREDAGSESIASDLGVAAKDFRQKLVAVLYERCHG
jgi:hypothetical protein